MILRCGDLVRRVNERFADDYMLAGGGADRSGRDFSFADEYESERILKKLSGRVSAIKGDHDKPAILDLMRSRRWRIVEPFQRSYRGQAVIFTHMPLPSPLPPNVINVHGHVHCHAYDASPSHINVSVEAIAYQPQRLIGLLDRVLKVGGVDEGQPTA